MELKVYKDTVTAAESICDTKLELPVETEMLIPDYLPQVFKIVKCFVYLVVLQKQVTAGRLTTSPPRSTFMVWVFSVPSNRSDSA